MAGTYYAAVEGDPLTSGEGSFVYSGKYVGAIADESGRPRRMAFIGDEAYCVACKSTGFITYGAGLNEHRRMIDLVNGGRLQAVGGDIVLCRCAEPPRIIAVYGRRWMIYDQGEEAKARVAKTRVGNFIHDEQFTLTDATGNPLANVWYSIRMPSGELVHGVTDSAGKTARYTTDGAQRLRVYLGHRESIT